MTNINNGKMIDVLFGFDQLRDFYDWCTNCKFEPEDKYVIYIKCANNSDDIKLQYWFCLIELLCSKTNEFDIRLVGGDSTEDEHTPITDELYFRFRTSAFFFLRRNRKIAGRFLARKASSADKYVRFESMESSGMRLAKKHITPGRILPFISIDDNSYNALVNTRTAEAMKTEPHSASNSITIEQDLIDLINIYRDRCNQGGIDENLTAIYDHNDTLLDSLVFISTLYSFVESNPNKNDIDLLHETCIDFSQGLAQLIENAYFHVVEKNRGVANFTVRIRTADDARYVEKDNAGAKKKFADVKYFMELYVTDLQFNGFSGVRQTFVNNVNSREARSDIDKVELSDIFTGNGDEMQNYLSAANNIAFHYGLQILNNVIQCADGCMNVKSDGEYCSLTDNDHKPYKNVNIEWDNGTAYVIYLPIQHSATIDCGNTVALTDNNFQIHSEYTKLDCKDSKYIELDCKVRKLKIIYNIMKKSKLSSRETDKILKAQLMSVAILSALSACKESKDQSDNIYYIDCTNLDLDWFEPLAKAVFMLMAGEGYKLENYEFNTLRAKDMQQLSVNDLKCTKPSLCWNCLALINLDDSQTVISLFRKFALFYNRMGRANIGDKSVFIVDKNAQIDILFGENLYTINNNIYFGQINGGIDERTIKIIKRFNNRGGNEL